MYEMMAGQVSRNRLCSYCLQLNVLKGKYHGVWYLLLKMTFNRLQINPE